MNTGFLGPAVATVLTVYGIETEFPLSRRFQLITWLQQYLPFTVLKPSGYPVTDSEASAVATVLTVYGIETLSTPL